MAGRSFHLSTLIVCILCAAAFSQQQQLTIDQEIAAALADTQARTALESRSIAALKSDASWQDKDCACRILQVIGTEKSIDAIAPLLLDPQLSHMARYALEPMPNPRVGSVLRNAAARASGRIQIGIIQSLGARADTDSVALLSPLASGADTDVAAAAVWALGRIATPAAAETLAKLYADAPQKLKSPLIDAMLTAADNLNTKGQNTAAARLYRQLRQNATSSHVRTSALAGLLASEPDKAVALLLKAVRDDDSIIRNFAIAQIGSVKAKGIAKRFTALLPNLPVESQVLLIEALAERTEPPVKPAITLCAASSDPAVRTAAVKALGDIGDASSVKVLVDVLAHGLDNEDASAAAASLRRLRADGAESALIDAMKKSPPSVQAELIAVLSDRNSRPAVDDILTIARAGDDNCTSAALRALGRLAGPDKLDSLLDVLARLQGDTLRTEAERAVTAVALKDRDKGAAAVLKALTAATDTGTRSSLLRIGGGIGGEMAFKATTAAAEDADPALQDAAIRVLADWPEPIALDKLLDIYRSDTSMTHRVLALRGCVRLLETTQIDSARQLAACSELIAKVKNAQEKRLVLARLANIPDPKALDVVRPLLDDTEVAAEAQLAMLGIARAIAPSSPDQAKTALTELLDKNPNPDLRKQARQLLNQLNK
jgi:HEAT repeat protein